MIIDGRAIATDVLKKVAEEIGRLGKTPRLSVIAARSTPAAESFLRIKQARAIEAGVHIELIRFPENASTEDLTQAIVSSTGDALIVQLPLPVNTNQQEVLDAIPEDEDADVLSSSARKKLAQRVPGALLPPVVCAVQKIFSVAGVDPRGKRALVIGAGRLVGAPSAAWLTSEGAEVETVVEGNDILSLLSRADIVVSGAGSPGLIKPEHLKSGVVLIDAGTSESGGRVVGDADPKCAEVASVFTPVPGGVGPVAVACLFENVLALFKRRLRREG